MILHKNAAFTASLTLISVSLISGTVQSSAASVAVTAQVPNASLRTMTHADVLKKINEVLGKLTNQNDKKFITEFKAHVEKRAIALPQVLGIWIRLSKQAQDLLVGVMASSGAQGGAMKPEQVIQKFWPDFQAAIKR